MSSEPQDQAIEVTPAYENLMVAKESLARRQGDLTYTEIVAWASALKQACYSAMGIPEVAVKDPFDRFCGRTFRFDTPNAKNGGLLRKAAGADSGGTDAEAE